MKVLRQHSSHVEPFMPEDSPCVVRKAAHSITAGRTLQAVRAIVSLGDLTHLAQLSGGGGLQVAYIDTEHTFRPERIRPIAVRFGLDADAVLDNVRSLIFIWQFVWEMSDTLIIETALPAIWLWQHDSAHEC